MTLALCHPETSSAGWLQAPCKDKACATEVVHPGQVCRCGEQRGHRTAPTSTPVPHLYAKSGKEQREVDEGGKLHRSHFGKRADGGKGNSSLPCHFSLLPSKRSKERFLEKLMFPLLHLKSSSDCCVFRLGGDGSDVYEKWISRLLGDLFSKWLFFGLLLLKWTISGKWIQVASLGERNAV